MERLCKIVFNLVQGGLPRWKDFWSKGACPFGKILRARGLARARGMSGRSLGKILSARGMSGRSLGKILSARGLSPLFLISQKNPLNKGASPFALLILTFLSLPSISFPQDTLHTKTDTLQIPLLSESKYYFINPLTPDTVTRNIFLWYPAKNTEDIFNHIPGYFLRYMDVGQVQNLGYNQLDYDNITVLRRGRPLNDLLHGSIDFNLLSRNEIQELELTKEYNNFLYNYTNAINVVDRQLFRNRPFSEISFWQDRHENLYFDGGYHQNIFKYFNFNFGITKHSYDGFYKNSDFDKWLGRFNFNYIGSKRFNAFFGFNYSKIQRGLNEGINFDSVRTLDREVLLDADFGVVNNPDARETRERFDVDAGFLFVLGQKKSRSQTPFGNEGFITKVQIFTSNSFREYRDSQGENDAVISDNTHWIEYGAKLSQQMNFRFPGSIGLSVRTEAEFDKDLFMTNFSSLRESHRIFLIGNFDLSVPLNKGGVRGLLKGLYISAFAKAFKFGYYDNEFHPNFGVKISTGLSLKPFGEINLAASYSKGDKLPSYQEYFLIPNLRNHGIESIFGVLSLATKIGSIGADIYRNLSTYSVAPVTYRFTRSGLNAFTGLHIWKIDLQAVYNCVLQSEEIPRLIASPCSTIPEGGGNILLSFRDVAFKSKFEYKVGFNSRFWWNYWAVGYNGFYNSFQVGDPNTLFLIGRNFTLDFFIIGKIEKAIFGLTLENILDRLYYTTGLYPGQQRGGLANVISRFNVTWYFLN
jgi:hypothetical protein